MQRQVGEKAARGQPSCVLCGSSEEVCGLEVDASRSGSIEGTTLRGRKQYIAQENRNLVSGGSNLHFL